MYITIEANNFVIECNMLKRKRLKIIVPKTSLRPDYAKPIKTSSTQQ